MKDLKSIKGVMWKTAPMPYGIKIGLLDLPTGVRCSVVAGNNEDGWEHVSVELYARRLPTWEEMCYIKDLFWDDEEEVVQIHPKKSQYVDMTEALHLWRPIGGDWRMMNRDVFRDAGKTIINGMGGTQHDD